MMGGQATDGWLHKGDKRVSSSEVAKTNNTMEPWEIEADKLAVKAHLLYAAGDEVGALLIAPSIRCGDGGIIRDAKVLDITEGLNAKVGSYPILTLDYEGEDGIRRVGMLHAVHTVLFDQLFDLGLQVGDSIDGIASLGERVSADGTAYGLWRVIGAGRAIRTYEWTPRARTGGKK